MGCCSNANSKDQSRGFETKEAVIEVKAERTYSDEMKDRPEELIPLPPLPQPVVIKQLTL